MNYQQMPRRCVLLVIMTVWACADTSAQRRVVVRDMETKTPLRDVQVLVDGRTDRRLVTDYKGECDIPDTIRSLVLCHPQYERRTMDSCEVGDTIELLPGLNKMDEVVIIGQKHKQMAHDISGMRKSVKGATAGMPKPSGMDFLSIFNWKKAKRQEERKKAIENY